ncbi:MAG: protein-tyrosine phosphatase family protein [Enterobacteriaceae bacterium]
MPAAQATMVKDPVGNPLPANRVQIDGKNVAIISQYPTAAHLQSYYGMLAENRTPVLLIMSSDKDIAERNLINYFNETNNHTYPDGTTVKSRRVDDVTFGPGLHARQYLLTVKKDNAVVTIPVVHPYDWEDLTAPDTDAIQKLIQHTSKLKEERIAEYTAKRSRAVGDPNKLLPVKHCAAGVGRSGYVEVMERLMQPDPPSSLQEVIEELRATRNYAMVQTDAQMNALAAFAAERGIPILKS